MRVQDGEIEGQRDREKVEAAAVSPSLHLADSPSTDSGAPPHETRNFWILVVYQVVLRAGWIFKTESVVMPHAADALDPSGLARGWLPLLNRFGQSVPPVLAALFLGRVLLSPAHDCVSGAGVAKEMKCHG